MYDLTKKEKLEFILEKVKELNFSAYEISKEIKLTEAGVSRILKGVAKNPHETSLDEIILFLERKVLGSKLSTKKNKVEEPEENYLSQATMEELEKNPLVKCLNEQIKLTAEITRLKDILLKNNIKF